MLEETPSAKYLLKRTNEQFTYLLRTLLENPPRDGIVFARHQPFLLVDNRVFARSSRRNVQWSAHRIECIAIRFEILSHCDWLSSLSRCSLRESWKRFTFLYARLVSRIRDRFPASWHLLSCGLLEKTTSRLSTMNTKHQTGCILASTIAICICSPRCRINLDFFFLFFWISRN